MVADDSRGCPPPRLRHFCIDEARRQHGVPIFEVALRLFAPDMAVSCVGTEGEFSDIVQDACEGG